MSLFIIIRIAYKKYQSISFFFLIVFSFEATFYLGLKKYNSNSALSNRTETQIESSNLLEMELLMRVGFHDILTTS